MNLPFGFGPGSGDDPADGPGDGTSGGIFGAAGFGGGGLPDELAGKVPLFAELQKLFAWSGGPVNWDLARQVAISTLSSGSTSVSMGERVQVEDAFRLADLWLDDATDLPSGVTSVAVWSRVEWIEKTLPVWTALCDPVAGHVVDSMSANLPAEIREQAGPMAPMLNQLGGMMFGTQVGQGLGALAAESLSSTDIGLPLGPPSVAALVPANIAEFGAGLDRPLEELRLFVALREAAHHRLFAHVPWLRQRLIDSVDAYARGITIDTSAIEKTMGELDPSNPQSVQELMSGGMFQPQDTPEQQAVLRRLEALLALVEGWVDAVVSDVTSNRLGGGEALREAFRRRRASGGPAEQTFATLVGLELRPRKLREAATFWAATRSERGQSGRDELWQHPDLLPDSDDLDDPIGFVNNAATAAAQTAGFDEALDALLSEAEGTSPDTPGSDDSVHGATKAAAGDGTEPGAAAPREDATDHGPKDEQPEA